jgi:hypothetical protein
MISMLIPTADGFGDGAFPPSIFSFLAPKVSRKIGSSVVPKMPHLHAIELNGMQRFATLVHA